MVGLDTNVLARYILRDDPAQYEAAASVIETLTTDAPGFVTHVALAELVWLLRTAYGMPRQDRLAVVRALVRTDAFEFEDGESVVRALAASEEGADFADALIAASGEMFGAAETVTFDRAAAARLGWRLLG